MVLTADVFAQFCQKFVAGQKTPPKLCHNFLLRRAIFSILFVRVHTNVLRFEGSNKMTTYKIDGAKFESMEELRSAMWTLHQNSMTPEAFEAYLIANVEEVALSKIAS